MVSDEVQQALLGDMFKSKDVGAIIQVLNQQNSPKEFDYAELCDELKLLSSGLELKTPALKRKKVETVATQFKSVLESWEYDTNSGLGTEEKDPVSQEKIAQLCNLTATCLRDDEIAIKTLGEQLEFVRTLIGNNQNESDYTTIWDGIQGALKNNELVIENFKQLPTKQDIELNMDSKVSLVQSEVRSLNAKAAESFKLVEEKFRSLDQKQAASPPKVSFFSSSASALNTDKSVSQIEDMLEEVRNMHQNAVSAQESSSDKGGAVVVGQYTFHTIHDLAAWCNIHMPSTLPFGGFIDIYSYLERVSSYKDIASTTVLKNMEIRQKLDLTADEALIIESFKHALPRIFNGSSLNASTFSSWLPGVPSKEKWEDSVGLSGAKITIRDNDTSIGARVEEVIG